jgi:tetratricopeptide (TPR) repeat protein
MVSRIGFGLALLLCGASARAQTPEEIYKKGIQLFQAHDLAAARPEFSRLLRSGPLAVKSKYYLGRIALLESKPAEAVQWLEPVAAADPAGLDAAAQLSRAYLETGQLGKAKDLTERAIHRTPWDGALHYRLGRIYQHMGDADGARKEFAESVRLKAADRESVELLLECSQHLANGEQPEALRVRQELLANASLDPDVLVALGLTFAGAGMQEASLEPFETAARRDPNFLQAEYNTGLALLKLGRAADAIAPLQASLRLAPDLMDANSALSLAYVLEARYADAMPTLEKWHRMQAGNPRAATMLALAYLRTGMAAKSVPLLRTVLRDPQKDPKAHFLLMEALNATERQQDALSVSEEAARLFPGIAQAHLAKAQQLARLGRYGDAGPAFTEALKLAPDQLDSMLGLGEVQQKKGDYAASLQTYRQALAQDRDNAAATLGVARNLLLLQKVAEARPVLEAAIKAHPENPQLHYELSRVYARLGERELAAEQSQVVKQLGSGGSKTP